MLEELFKYFEEKSEFIKFNNEDFEYLIEVFGSPQQIFGISVFENESILQTNWKDAANEFAYKIQSRLVDDLHGSKWDMYLILVTPTDISSIEACKEIENNRMYFRKIVIANNLELFSKKLPVKLEIDHLEKLTFFSDELFLEELKGVVSEESKEKLNIKTYLENPIDLANELTFLSPYADKEEAL